MHSIYLLANGVTAQMRAIKLIIVSSSYLTTNREIKITKFDLFHSGPSH
jgi:hypothetical protein